MKIFPESDRPTRQGPAEWFTGTVWIDPVVTGAPPAHIQAARVAFAPGARTNWHTHPRGQTLHVLQGVGRVQLRGEPRREIHPGDVVWIEAGEVHWHGAAPGRTMVHLAMQEADEQGSAVNWLEPVTDEEYSAPAQQA